MYSVSEPILPPGQHTGTPSPLTWFCPNEMRRYHVNLGQGDLEEAVEKRNKFPLQGLPGLRTSGLFSWREKGDQSNLARALSGKIDNVRVVVVVGGDQISRRKEHR